MRQLAIDCLHDCVFLAANRDLLFEIFGTQRFQRIKHGFPTAFPVGEHVIFTRVRFNQKLHVAMRSGFSPSEVRKSVQRESMLPAMCFMTTATLFPSSSRVTKTSSSFNWAMALSA